MALIVGVHGIAQQGKGAPKLVNEWWPSLESGVTNAGRTVPPNALSCAFYGGLFRGPESLRAIDPPYVPADVADPFERELLTALWVEAASREPRRVVAPEAEDLRLPVPKTVQAGLQALSKSKLFTRVAEAALIFDLKQVKLYMKDESIRSAAQDAVNAVVGTDTRVIVAHSLGSVVAYEALHRFADQPNWSNVRTFVTLGSPLGIANLIFHALRPRPVKGQGVWPRRLKRWTNISDDYDVVALQKRLQDFFDGGIVDVRIDNGATAHDASPYLTAKATGVAITNGLV